MATLRGILAELGIENPATHTDKAQDAEWVPGRQFDPQEGACYELAFARIPASEDEPHVIKQIRVDGPTAEDWFDLDRHKPLDRALYAYAVKAFRRLDPPHDDAGNDTRAGDVH